MASPDILFLISDQHHPQFMGCAGNPWIRTPHLDELAEQGTRMENLYCGSPLCVPSRMAMLSGLLPSRTGIYTNFNCLPEEQPTFVHSLAGAGYHTVLSGRMHFNGANQRHGYQKRLIGDITPVYPQGRGMEIGEFGMATGQNRTSLKISGPGNSSVLEYDRAVTETTLAFLENYQDPQPLFLTVGLYGPHCPFICPPELFQYYFETITPPDYPPDFMETVHPFIRQWIRNRGIENPDPKDVRRSIAAYYGLVETVDKRLGSIIHSWRENPRFRDSLIVYVSDHGEMAGDKGLFWKSSFYEGSVKVPCIIHQPGTVPANRVIQEPASLLDLGPTLIELTRADPLPESDGHNLLPLWMEDRPEQFDRPVVSLLGDMKGDTAGAMIRRGDWKLMTYHGYEHTQLFHLKNDPDELRDLGQDPDHQAIREELLRQLDPFWDANAAARVVSRMQAKMNYWKQWKESNVLDSRERWVAQPKHNYLTDT